MPLPDHVTKGSLLRFVVVGLGATGTYLLLSLLLLKLGLAPWLTNSVAFLCSTAASYLGHYFYTFRSDKAHLTAGSQFVVVTLCLLGLSLLIQHGVLSLGFSAQWAAVAVALAYPPLSFVANSLLTFAKR